MSLFDVLFALREKLLQARTANNREDAEELMIIFDALTLVSYDSPNRVLTSLLVELTDSARDIVMGVSWKSTIPTVEQLQAAFSEAS